MFRTQQGRRIQREAEKQLNIIDKFVKIILNKILILLIIIIVKVGEDVCWFHFQAKTIKRL